MSIFTNKSDALPKLTESGFLVNAWSQYLRTCVESYSRLIAAGTQALESEVPVEARKTRSSWEDKCRAVAEDILAEYDIYPNALVALEKGYMTASDLLTNLVFAGDYYADVNMNDPMEALENPDLYGTLYNAAGAILPASLSPMDMIDSLRTAMHSSIVMQAAFSSASITDMSARLAFFKDQIAANYTNIYDDISDAFKVFYSMLSTGWKNPRYFISQCRDMMGMLKQEQDGDFTLNQSDFSQYSGANPLAVLDFKNAMDALEAGIEVTGQVIGGIVNTVTSWFGTTIDKWTSDTSRWMLSVSDRPYDLKVVNQNSSVPTISGFGVNKSNITISETNLKYVPIECWRWRSSLQEFLNSRSGSWFKVDTIPFEMMFKINSVGAANMVEQADPDYCSMSFTNVSYDFVIKPKPIPPRVAFDALTYAGFSPTWYYNQDYHTACGITIPGFDLTPYEINEKLGKFAEYLQLNNNPNQFLDTSVEPDAWNSFFLGYRLGYWFMNLSNLSMGTVPDTEVSQTSETITFCHIDDIWENVSNTDWVMLASGWNGNTSNPYFTEYIPVKNSVSTRFRVSDVSRAFVELFIWQQVDRYMHPTNYMFLPYCHGVEGFSESRYGINTDKENGIIATRAIIQAVAVTVVVAAAITVVSLVSKIRRQSYFKKAEFVGRMDNKMWNGGSLTDEEMVRYVRYARRLNASSLLTGGLLNQVSSMANSLVSNSVGDLSVQDLLSNRNQSVQMGAVGNNVTDIAEATAGLPQITQEVRKIGHSITGINR